MLKNILFGFLMILLSCSPKEHAVRSSFKGLPLIDFCYLPNYQSKEVFTRAFYSGIVKYWSLSAPNSCNNGYQVNLDFGDSYDKLLGRFKDVLNEKQSFRYLIIDAVGVFETGREEGYGHLGTNNARFILKEIVDIKGIK